MQIHPFFSFWEALSCKGLQIYDFSWFLCFENRVKILSQRLSNLNTISPFAKFKDVNFPPLYLWILCSGVTSQVFCNVTPPTVVKDIQGVQRISFLNGIQRTIEVIEMNEKDKCVAKDFFHSFLFSLRWITQWGTNWKLLSREYHFNCTFYLLVDKFIFHHSPIYCILHNLLL